MKEPFFHQGLATIHLGDCVEVMGQMEENSVDAVVTDPPYGLEFMGNEWDSLQARIWRGGNKYPDGADKFTGTRPAYIAGKEAQDFHNSWAAEALRILKPGGHLLAMGATRTHHRLVCGIEDVGFEIRDTLCWIYASGFPKSMDISKGFDKRAGVEGEVVGVETVGTGMQSGHMHAGRPQRLEEREVRAPATELAKRWQGWGTALKPAWEPIVLARKPLQGTVCDNVERWGVGGLDIESNRIPYQGDADPRTFGTGWKQDKAGQKVYSGDWARDGRHVSDEAVKGRFPANVVVDVEDCRGPLEGVMVEGEGKPTPPHSVRSNVPQYSGWGSITRKQGEVVNYPENGLGDGILGPYTRFFVIPKPGRAEKGKGTTHPTVKPVRLFEHLVRLVAPEGALVLDPFLGSGTTILACMNLGRRCVGIEKNEEYCQLAAERCRQVAML